jgi:thiamine transport system ATP-binding protein
MLDVTGLRYRHNGVVTTEYLYDLDVEAGHIACLTGKSGSGKSTCLDLIAGFLQPHSGQVQIDGTDILTLAPEYRPLTILFQRDNLFDHLSASQNVALGTNTSLRLTDDEKRDVEDALDRVGLLPLAGQRAGQLSGGEQQRIALARCLIRQRPVLLLDEPFGALDRETRADMISLVRKIVSEQSLAALMVTHDFNELEKAADRHYELIDGCIRRLK